jgi:DNA-directed RNA polymerase alpha subunit
VLKVYEELNCNALFRLGVPTDILSLNLWSSALVSKRSAVNFASVILNEKKRKKEKKRKEKKRKEKKRKEKRTKSAGLIPVTYLC